MSVPRRPEAPPSPSAGDALAWGTPRGARGDRVNTALLAIIGEGILSRLSFGIISFALPLYARHLGMSLTQIGILAALNTAVAIALKPIMGWAADRFGLKRAFLGAVGLRSVVSLLFGFASVPWQLYSIRALHGVSVALRDPAATVLIAEQGGERSVASAFAWYQTAKTVAGTASKALAGFLLALTASNYHAAFLLAFALSALPFLMVLLFVKDPGRVESVAPAGGASIASREAEPERPRRVLPFAILGLLIASSAEMLTHLFPVLATEYAGLTSAEAGFIYAASTVLSIIAGPLFGWLSDRVSRNLVLLIRSISNVLSSVAYLLSPTLWGVGIAKGVDDLGKAAFRPAWGAIMGEVASMEKRSRARAVSWMSMGEDLGGVVAPLLAGLLWSTWGIVALMGARVVLAVASEGYAIAVAHARRGGAPPRP